MNSNSIVKTVGLGLTLVVATGVNVDKSETRKVEKPNIIFIICDDLNDSVEGFGGHPQCLTPNLDKMAEMGIRFINAQNNNPVCGPSRASLISGLYPHSSGYFGYNFNRDHWRNNPVLKESLTFLDFFRDHGYKVMGTGKVFHNTQEEWESFDEYGYRPSWGPWPWDGTSDTVYSFGQLGEAPNAVFHQDFTNDGFFLKTDMFGPLSNIPDIKPEPEKGIPGYKGWRLYNKPFKYNNENDRDLMPDELNAKWAVEKLNEQHDKPFMLCVGINRPHAPLFAPDKYFDLFPLEEVELTTIKEDDLEDCAKILFGQNADASTLGFRRYSNYMKMGGNELLRKWTQAYLANVAFVDDQIGKIIEALSNSDYAKNTYVIFTSDHGYHMGEKNYLFKNSVWEESCRVPFIVTGPDVKKDKICEHPVSLIDLYPSFIDMAGFKKDDVSPQNLDGYSIRPFFKNPEKGNWQGPDAAITSVHSMKRLKRGEPGELEKQHYSLRTKNYRYIWCNNGEEELYDHTNDPFEWDNLTDDPDYKQIKMEMRSKMNKMLGEDLIQ